MKKKKEDNNSMGLMNVLLTGRNAHSVSIADNIRNSFKNQLNEVDNTCSFNIVEDIEAECPSHSWFNEFIFDITSVSKYNNIVMSRGFYDWIPNATPIEKMYMKKLLQAMNFIIVDIHDDDSHSNPFSEDIPQMRFEPNTGFLVDLYKWIDSNLTKVKSKETMIRLVKSLCGNSIPYLGDVFGCYTDRRYTYIIHADDMRFDVPILFEEFCKLTKGKDIDEIDKCIFTRRSSAMSVFFK